MKILPKLLLLALVCSLDSMAQQPGNKPKTPVTTQKEPVNNNSNPPVNNQRLNNTESGTDAFSRIAITTVDSAIEAKLVDLALNGPAFKASAHRNKIEEYELRKAKNSWLNLLTISTNYNDQTFAKASPTTPAATYVYPKYFFGVSIPLGIIFSQGTQIKSAKESLALTNENQDELARNIKAGVVSKYRQYKLYNGLIEMQSELMNDVLANATQAEDNFKKNSIAVETYITALKTKNEEAAKYLNLKYEQDVIKLDIERMIGIPLEQALQPDPVATTPVK